VPDKIVDIDKRQISNCNKGPKSGLSIGKVRVSSLSSTEIDVRDWYWLGRTGHWG